MFSSIVCAANWDGWESALTVWAIVLGDEPHLNAETLRALLAFQARHLERICQPSYGGHGRHPVLLPRRAWVELGKFTGPHAEGFFAGGSEAVGQIPMEDVGLALDVDTPRDYRTGAGDVHRRIHRRDELRPP